NIYEFERAAKDWLNGYPNRLRVAVEFEIRNTRERQSVSNFFGDTSSIGDKLANEHINTPSTPVKIPPTPTPIASDIEEPSQPDRVKQETYRILRDTNLARRVKEEKKYKCEICDQSLELKEGRLYTEVHHIIPLGTPHNGPDVRGNILCVCPNHHVLLDYGAIKLDGEKLNSTDNKYVDYHNTHIYGKI
ncbi:MAG: HNH endonuclease, partial [Candidatus Paceibacterota bacterium]